MGEFHTGLKCSSWVKIPARDETQPGMKYSHVMSPLIAGEYTVFVPRLSEDRVLHIGANDK